MQQDAFADLTNWTTDIKKTDKGWMRGKTKYFECFAEIHGRPESFVKLSFLTANGIKTFSIENQYDFIIIGLSIVAKLEHHVLCHLLYIFLASSRNS